MRSLGQLTSQDLATRFGDYLYVQDIENQIDLEDDGSCSIWILDETQLPQASVLLERFRAAPDTPEFITAGSAASRKRSAEERAKKKRRTTTADAARIGYERHFGGFAWLPAFLIVISAAVAIYSRVGEDFPALRYLLISADLSPIESLPEIRSGQFWRLISPIFIHFGWLHLIFNMFWLRDLGTFTQNRFGATYLGALIAISAALSNVGQFFWGGPVFGGMSGVNYALFGFLWLRGKCDRNAAWSLNPTIVQSMLIWLVLCMTGLLGPVANGAHAVGFFTGAAWGLLSSGRLRFSP